MNCHQNKEKNLSDSVIIEVEAKEGESISFNISATKYIVDWGDNTPYEQSFNQHIYEVNKNITIIITGINFTSFHITKSKCIIKRLKIKSPTLETLDCSNLNLKKLDITECTNLISLFCYANKLNDLLLTSLKQLAYLDCKYNKLKNLDLSDCPNIITVICSHNCLKAINIRNCVNLVYLNLFNNRLSVKELNSLILNLPTGSTKMHQINIGLNPGAEKSDLKLLKLINWSLDVSLSVPQV